MSVKESDVSPDAAEREDLLKTHTIITQESTELDHDDVDFEECIPQHTMLEDNHKSSATPPLKYQSFRFVALSAAQTMQTFQLDSTNSTPTESESESEIDTFPDNIQPFLCNWGQISQPTPFLSRSALSLVGVNPSYISYVSNDGSVCVRNRKQDQILSPIHYWKAKQQSHQMLNRRQSSETVEIVDDTPENDSSALPPTDIDDYSFDDWIAPHALKLADKCWAIEVRSSPIDPKLVSMVTNDGSVIISAMNTDPNCVKVDQQWTHECSEEKSSDAELYVSVTWHPYARDLLFIVKNSECSLWRLQWEPQLSASLLYSFEHNISSQSGSGAPAPSPLFQKAKNLPLSGIVSLSVSHDEKYLLTCNAPIDIRYMLRKQASVSADDATDAAAEREARNRALQSTGQTSERYRQLPHLNSLNIWRLPPHNESGSVVSDSVAPQLVSCVGFHLITSYVRRLLKEDKSESLPTESGDPKSPKFGLEMVHNAQWLLTVPEKVRTMVSRSPSGEAIPPTQHHVQHRYFITISKRYNQPLFCVDIWRATMYLTDTNYRPKVRPIQRLSICTPTVNTIPVSVAYNCYSAPYLVINTASLDPSRDSQRYKEYFDSKSTDEWDAMLWDKKEKVMIDDNGNETGANNRLFLIRIGFREKERPSMAAHHRRQQPAIQPCLNALFFSDLSAPAINVIPCQSSLASSIRDTDSPVNQAAEKMGICPLNKQAWANNGVFGLCVMTVLGIQYFEVFKSGTANQNVPNSKSSVLQPIQLLEQYPHHSITQNGALTLSPNAALQAIGEMETETPADADADADASADIAEVIETNAVEREAVIAAAVVQVEVEAGDADIGDASKKCDERERDVAKNGDLDETTSTGSILDTPALPEPEPTTNTDAIVAANGVESIASDRASDGGNSRVSLKLKQISHASEEEEDEAISSGDDSEMSSTAEEIEMEEAVTNHDIDLVSTLTVGPSVSEIADMERNVSLASFTDNGVDELPAMILLSAAEISVEAEEKKMASESTAAALSAATQPPTNTDKLVDKLVDKRSDVSGDGNEDKTKHVSDDRNNDSTNQTDTAKNNSDGAANTNSGSNDEKDERNAAVGDGGSGNQNETTDDGDNNSKAIGNRFMASGSRGSDKEEKPIGSSTALAALEDEMDSLPELPPDCHARHSQSQSARRKQPRQSEVKFYERLDRTLELHTQDIIAKMDQRWDTYHRKYSSMYESALQSQLTQFQTQIQSSIETIGSKPTSTATTIRPPAATTTTAEGTATAVLNDGDAAINSALLKHIYEQLHSLSQKMESLPLASTTLSATDVSEIFEKQLEEKVLPALGKYVSLVLQNVSTQIILPLISNGIKTSATVVTRDLMTQVQHRLQLTDSTPRPDTIADTEARQQSDAPSVAVSKQKPKSKEKEKKSESMMATVVNQSCDKIGKRIEISLDRWCKNITDCLRNDLRSFLENRAVEVLKSKSTDHSSKIISKQGAKFAELKREIDKFSDSMQASLAQLRQQSIVTKDTLSNVEYLSRRSLEYHQQNTTKGGQLTQQQQQHTRRASFLSEEPNMKQGWPIGTDAGSSLHTGVPLLQYGYPHPNAPPTTPHSRPIHSAAATHSSPQLEYLLKEMQQQKQIITQLQKELRSTKQEKPLTTFSPHSNSNSNNTSSNPNPNPNPNQNANADARSTANVGTNANAIVNNSSAVTNSGSHKHTSTNYPFAPSQPRMDLSTHTSRALYPHHFSVEERELILRYASPQSRVEYNPSQYGHDLTWKDELRLQEVCATYLKGIHPGSAFANSTPDEQSQVIWMQPFECCTRLKNMGCENLIACVFENLDMLNVFESGFPRDSVRNHVSLWWGLLEYFIRYCSVILKTPHYVQWKSVVQPNQFCIVICWLCILIGDCRVSDHGFTTDRFENEISAALSNVDRCYHSTDSLTADTDCRKLKELLQSVVSQTRHRLNQKSNTDLRAMQTAPNDNNNNDTADVYSRTTIF